MSDDDYPGDSSGSAAAGPHGPAARWATVLSPVAPEFVVRVLASNRQWQVTPLNSGFILHGRGPLQAVVAEAEVVPTETGCRIQIALHRTEPSSVPATVAGVATMCVAIPAVLAWWVGHHLWWLGLLLTAVGLVTTAQQLGRLSRRVTEQERAGLVTQIAKALRGQALPA